MKKNIFAIFLLIALSVLCYKNTLNAPFTYDDDNYIIENPAIKTFHFFLDPSALYKLNDLTPTYQVSFNTRILGYLTLALNYRMNGVNVFGYHIVNLLFHFLNSILVYFLVSLTLSVVARRKNPSPRDEHFFTRDYLISISAALLFCVHPVNTSAVTYVSQRFASMVTVFYLFTFVAFTQYRISGNTLFRRGWYISAVVVTIAAMLTKENSFTLPYLLVAYDYMFLPAEKKKFLKHLPFLSASLLVPFNMLRAQHLLSAQLGINAIHVLAASDGVTAYGYFLTQFRALLTYLRLVVFPVDQRVFYDFPLGSSILDPGVVLGFLVFLAFIIAGLFWYRSGRREGKEHLRLASFGILWFLVTRSIESSFIPNLNAIMEYRLYLSLPGLLLAAVAPVLTVANWGRKQIIVAGSLVVALVAIFTVATINRNKVWQSNITLWEDNVVKSPGSAQAHHFLSVAYARSGKFYDAMNQALKALELRPNYIEVHINLGLIYANLGYYNEALSQLEIARVLCPSYAHLNDIINIVINKKEETFRVENAFASRHKNR